MSAAAVQSHGSFYSIQESQLVAGLLRLCIGASKSVSDQQGVTFCMGHEIISLLYMLMLDRVAFRGGTWTNALRYANCLLLRPVFQISPVYLTLAFVRPHSFFIIHLRKEHKQVLELLPLWPCQYWNSKLERSVMLVTRYIFLIFASINNSLINCVLRLISDAASHKHYNAADSLPWLYWDKISLQSSMQSMNLTRRGPDVRILLRFSSALLCSTLFQQFNHVPDLYQRGTVATHMAATLHML